MPPTLSPGVRRVVMTGAGVPLSALLAGPVHGPPRATVVALHGGGMSAGYFDGQAHPDVSLMTLAARLGYAVLSVDRPGYGLSAARLPEGRTLAEQSRALRAALQHYFLHHEAGAGFLLLAHSYGGKLAFTAAAQVGDGEAPVPGAELLGLDVSGCGHQRAAVPERGAGSEGREPWTRAWGALRLYPPGTFRASTALVSPMPERERLDVLRWPAVFPSVAGRVRVPVRLTFAEHEAWWRHDDAAVEDLRSHLAAPRVVVDRAPDAGHNISLGWAARAYHLKALAFLEECLAGRA
ncbi:alpha/beta hydrolase [Streptomyces sp. NPDC059639]|uniref:alpha/beta hydrolase n=1 Tax=Streptomyces sp. NPDC059639 TaxID=3346891 RepID=UPI0036BEE164